MYPIRLEILWQQRETHLHPHVGSQSTRVPKETESHLLNPEEQTEWSVYHFGCWQLTPRYMPGPSGILYLPPIQKIGPVRIKANGCVCKQIWYCQIPHLQQDSECLSSPPQSYERRNKHFPLTQVKSGLLSYWMKLECLQLSWHNSYVGWESHINYTSKSRIILLRKREENIARQQSPITRDLFTALLDMAKKLPIDSVDTVVADWFTFIRITGLRLSEYVQKSQSTFEENEYSSG